MEKIAIFFLFSSFLENYNVYGKTNGTIVFLARFCIGIVLLFIRNDQIFIPISNRLTIFPKRWKDKKYIVIVMYRRENWRAQDSHVGTYSLYSVAKFIENWPCNQYTYIVLSGRLGAEVWFWSRFWYFDIWSVHQKFVNH